jgi:hypothetical protein
VEPISASSIVKLFSISIEIITPSSPNKGKLFAIELVTGGLAIPG